LLRPVNEPLAPRSKTEKCLVPLFINFPPFAMTCKQRSKKTEGREGSLGSELTRPSKASHPHFSTCGSCYLHVTDWQVPVF
jgi:hypothetical protein